MSDDYWPNVSIQSIKDSLPEGADHTGVRQTIGRHICRSIRESIFEFRSRHQESPDYVRVPTCLIPAIESWIRTENIYMTADEYFDDYLGLGLEIVGSDQDIAVGKRTATSLTPDDVFEDLDYGLQR